jgi:AcrR family transcriptional regulator
MDEDLIEAAARVLAREGPARFTTNRVAAAAGASVGSLYQYYPNKAALLLRLHDRDGERLWLELEALLDDARAAPRVRLGRVIRRFLAVQAAAADHHEALHEARAQGSATAEFRAFEDRVVARLAIFLRAAGRRDAAFLARVAVTVLAGVGDRLATRRRPARELARLAAAVTRMLVGFLRL